MCCFMPKCPLKCVCFYIIQWEYYCKKKRSISPSKKMKVDDSTPTPNCLRPLENTIVDGGTFAPGVQVALEEVAVDDHCSIDAPCYADLEMQQNPSENESHIAKLSERDKKSVLSDSTKYEVESIHNESERNTPHKKRGLECKACEDVFDSNKLISTFSVVSPNVQVCKEKDEEIVVNPMKCQEDKRIEKIDLMENYPTTALSINHDDKGGKNSETTPTFDTSPQELKGNKDESYFCKHEELVSEFVDTLDQRDILIANKFDLVELITHDEVFTKILPAEILCYIILDKHVEIHDMLEKVSEIASLKSLNSIHVCKYTFNLIGGYAENKFYMCAICITCDKLADLRLKLVNNHAFEPSYAQRKLNKMFGACCLEPFMSPTCAYFSSETLKHNGRNDDSLKIFSSMIEMVGFETNEFDCSNMLHDTKSWNADLVDDDRDDRRVAIRTAPFTDIHRQDTRRRAQLLPPSPPPPKKRREY